MNLTIFHMKTDKNNTHEHEREIIFSRTVNAGKRTDNIYVKKNRADDQYLCLT